MELEKVKKRRQDRENEKLARDEEMQLLQREKEAAMFSVGNCWFPVTSSN